MEEEDSLTTDGSDDLLSFTYKDPEEDKILLCENYGESSGKKISSCTIPGIVVYRLNLESIKIKFEVNKIYH